MSDSPQVPLAHHLKPNFRTAHENIAPKQGGSGLAVV